MTQETEKPWTAGSVVLYGDCNLVRAAALMFRMMDWQVTLVSDPEHRDAISRYFAGFQFGPEITLESNAAEGESRPDFRVHCVKDGLPASMRATRRDAPVIELSGVSHDDRTTPPWTSCSELIADMRSGFGMLTRPKTDAPGSPFLPAGIMPSYFLALHAVFLATAALEAAERPQRVQLSAQECLLAALHFTIGSAQAPAEQPAVPGPQGPRVGGTFQCSDGEIFVLTPTQDLWQPLLSLVWKDEWAEQDWWRDWKGSQEQGEHLNTALVEFCAARSRLEAVDALQKAGAPTAIVASAEDVIANPHLTARGFLNKTDTGEMVLGRPFRVVVADKSTLPTPSQPAGESRATKFLPLSGLTVCDLSWWWAGPFSGMCLSQLGAHVIKVEGRTKVDQHRLQRPFIETDAPLYDRSFIHFQTGRGKQSLALDFKKPDAIRVIKDLIAKCDILISNFQPDTLSRLGLGFDVASQIVGGRPFVFAALSGFGATGPWRDYRSFGANLAAMGALPNLTGTEATGPVDLGVPFTDPIGGISAAAALVNCLRRARELRAPIYFDLAQFEAQVLCFNEALRIGRQLGNKREGDLAGTGVYRCSGTDSWLGVSVRAWEALARLNELLGLPKSEALPGTDAELEAALASWAASRTKQDAARELRSAGIDATEVLSVGELFDDESLHAAGFWYRTGPEEGEMIIEHAPWRVDGRRSAAIARAPLLGEHNERVLTELLGYPAARVQALKEAGVLE